MFQSPLFQWVSRILNNFKEGVACGTPKRVSQWHTINLGNHTTTCLLHVHTRPFGWTMVNKSPATATTLLKLLVCVCGIYGAYLTQGGVQDALATQTFGKEEVRFPHLSTLHALQSWTCFAWAFLLLHLGKASRYWRRSMCCHIHSLLL
jgi:hypothetical protein